MIILTGICLNLVIFLTVMSIHFLHFDTIKILLPTIIMFNLTFPTVIFITINFIRVSFCKVWIEIIIVLPYFIICVVLINLIVRRLLRNFWLSQFLLLLIYLFLSVFLFIVDLLPLLVCVGLYSIRYCVIVVLLYLLQLFDSIIFRLLFIWNISMMTIRCSLFIDSIIIFLNICGSFIFGETSIKELYFSKIFRI